MAKKSKRSRGRSSGRGVGDGNAVVSDSDASHGNSPFAAAASASASAPAQDEPARKAPALRSVEEQTAETPDDLRCADPYEDVWDDDDDASYEDVYESSGDEDDEYAEAMATGDGGDGGASSGGAWRPASVPAIDADDGANRPARVRSWNPFAGSDSGDRLEMDESAYKMHHALTPEWPSLTLDVVRDRHLGDHRTRFPHTVTMVVGSQADVAAKNKISVLRLSDLSRIPGSSREKTEKELDDEMLGEEWKNDDGGSEGGEASESEDEDEEDDLDPVLEHYSFPHPCGGVNRVRVCPHNSDILGAWSDSGVVSLYDIGGALDTLDRSSLGSRGEGAKGRQLPARKMRKDPFFVYSGHSAEGYAIDWSPVTPGRLATADCDGNIHIWNATHPVVPAEMAADRANKKGGRAPSPWCNSSFGIQPTYSAHGDNLDNPSVEDLQWSPTEATVLASAECGGYVRIYDVRCPGKAMISNKIHSNGADVNVISWNRHVSNLLASGGDDGCFSVWDLRTFQSAPPKPLARFQCHRTPITSLEWHPTDESMIAVSDDRGTYVYDLSVEEDDPDRRAAGGEDDEGGVEGEIPPQLLFVHSGSEMTKEVHWHPQIPSCLATTSLSGFSVFIPSNL